MDLDHEEGPDINHDSPKPTRGLRDIFFRSQDNEKKVSSPPSLVTSAPEPGAATVIQSSNVESKSTTSPLSKSNNLSMSGNITPTSGGNLIY